MRCLNGWFFNFPSYYYLFFIYSTSEFTSIDYYVLECLDIDNNVYFIFYVLAGSGFAYFYYILLAYYSTSY